MAEEEESGQMEGDVCEEWGSKLGRSVGGGVYQ